MMFDSKSIKYILTGIKKSDSQEHRLWTADDMNEIESVKPHAEKDYVDLKVYKQQSLHSYGLVE